VREWPGLPTAEFSRASITVLVALAIPLRCPA
jgi:hypothetical protein